MSEYRRQEDGISDLVHQEKRRIYEENRAINQDRSLYDEGLYHREDGNSSSKDNQHQRERLMPTGASATQNLDNPIPGADHLGAHGSWLAREDTHWMPEGHRRLSRQRERHRRDDREEWYSQRQPALSSRRPRRRDTDGSARAPPSPYAENAPPSYSEVSRWQDLDNGGARRDYSAIESGSPQDRQREHERGFVSQRDLRGYEYHSRR